LVNAKELSTYKTMKKISKLLVILCGAILASCDICTIGTAPAEGVSINRKSVDLMKGDAVTLLAYITPKNVKNCNVKWSSSNTAVATVDASGKVTTINEGTAEIVATTEEGGFTATCNIFVYPVYTTPQYFARAEQSYAYVDDKIKLVFIQVDSKITDLTNTGNPQIKSSFSINGTPQTTSEKTCTGELTLTKEVTAKEDSVAVYVEYNAGAQKHTAISKGLRVYNNPVMEMKNKLSIKLSGTCKHFWKDDCSIVDNDGNDYTKMIHYDGSYDYVLDLTKKDMWDKTYTLYYGPEKRTASIVIPPQTQN